MAPFFLLMTVIDLFLFTVAEGESSHSCQDTIEHIRKDILHFPDSEEEEINSVSVLQLLLEPIGGNEGYNNPNNCPVYELRGNGCGFTLCEYSVCWGLPNEYRVDAGSMIRLGNDIKPCPANGLKVMGDVTLDGAGHTVSGTNAAGSVGIAVELGAIVSRVQVQQFAVGVDIWSSQGLFTVMKQSLISNCTLGLDSLAGTFPEPVPTQTTLDQVYVIGNKNGISLNRYLPEGNHGFRDVVVCGSNESDLTSQGTEGLLYGNVICSVGSSPLDICASTEHLFVLGDCVDFGYCG